MADAAPSPPPTRRVRSARTVLLAMRSSWCPPFVVERAAQVARAMRARLEVLRVTDEEEEPDAEEELRVWAAQARARAAPISAVHLEGGRFIEELAYAAKDLSTCLVLLPASDDWRPRAITAMVRASQVPVMVVRAPMGRLVVAATDLAHAGHPVVQTAARLVEGLTAPLVVVHNLSEPVRELEPRRHQLAKWLERVAPGARPVLLRQPRTDDAILAAARGYTADLVVVGAPLAWRRHRSGTAERVLSNARRTVLVTPL